MKRRAKAILSIFGAAILAAGTFSGCGKKDLKPEEVESVAASVPEEPSAPPVNPFTGHAIDQSEMGKRPTAVVINNHKKAWPQNGISQADMIYEVPVEGGYTRLIAVYYDNTVVEKVGSIRSVRHDFVELVLPFDPVFIHWGGSSMGYRAVRADLDSIDGMAYGDKYFITDRSLKRSIEHTRFMEQDGMQAAISALDFEMERETENQFQFAEKEVAFDNKADKVDINASSVIKTAFHYDEAAKTYTKTEYGTDTLDGNTGEPVQIKNAFILFDSVPVIDNKEHVDLELESGSGYYLTNGTYCEINWEKGAKENKIRYFDTEGNELAVNPGNSWILFVAKERADDVTFSGTETNE